VNAKMSSEDVDGSYPNETDDSPTFDSNEQLRRIKAKKARWLQADEIENEANTARKSATDDGDKREYSVEGYPFDEAKAQKKPHADTEKTPKSPAQ
jgi:hypothetical protein